MKLFREVGKVKQGTQGVGEKGERQQTERWCHLRKAEAAGLRLESQQMLSFVLWADWATAVDVLLRLGLKTRMRR